MDKNTAFFKTESLLSSGMNILVAIDGMSASGKTTFALELARRFGGAALHMDDFFLPLAMRSGTDENIDFARLRRDVLPHLFTAFDYDAFDCRTQTYYRKHSPAARLAIIEGAYSLHPALGLKPDLSIFMETAPELQQARLSAREGTNIAAFNEKWLPREAAYFECFGIKEKCDIVVEA